MQPVQTQTGRIQAKIGKYRWRIVALLFFATTINYIDRQVFSLVVIDDGFRSDISLTKEQIGFIDSAFKAAYAIGYLLVGALLDRIGTRKGFSFSLIFWSIAAMAHAFARTPFTFGLARFGLGFGEAGNFPASIKTVAEWFPKKERSFATGVFNSGSNIGAIAAPLIVPFIALNYGWEWAFIVTGALGFIWLIFWRAMYRKPEEHPKLSQAELAYINSDPAESVTKVPWLRLFTYRQTWSFAMGKFLTDPIWWFYLTWLPLFFNENKNLDQNLDLKNIGIPFIIIYLISDVGSIAGGWFSSFLAKRGLTINQARKTTMFLCALCVAPIYFASVTSSLNVAIALIALATAAHQGWSANLYTLTSDMFPRKAVGSVMGIGGTMGAVGGTLLAAAAGVIIQNFGYQPMFIIASSAYLIAFAVIQFLVPRLEPANLP